MSVLTTEGKRKVHITDERGEWRYNRLLDDGSHVLRFESGGGFIDKGRIPATFAIRDGWVR